MSRRTSTRSAASWWSRSSSRGRTFEVILIDDGSTDDTFAKLAAQQAHDARLRVIRFRRNFGQTAAFAAGFAHARGAYIVTSDGDLQNDPRDIPRMLDLHRAGARHRLRLAQGIGRTRS